MELPAEAPWNVDVSDEDFEKMIVGFQPRDMDDKWAADVEGPTATGDYTITFSRSWTGRKHYILLIKPRVGSESARIARIVWEQDKSGIYVSEEQGKKEAIQLCRGLLDCEIMMLPHHDSAAMDNPYAYVGTPSAREVLGLE